MRPTDIPLPRAGGAGRGSPTTATRKHGHRGAAAGVKRGMATLMAPRRALEEKPGPAAQAGAGTRSQQPGPMSRGVPAGGKFQRAETMDHHRSGSGSSILSSTA
eukprot:8893316-Pyramimonas_sp.AAC.1